MRTTLFRQEAIDAQRGTLLGAALARQRLPFALVSLLSAAAALALLALCLFGEYTRKVHVGGYLAPSSGAIKVVAGQPGTLISKQIREGRRVRTGDMLFVLSAERASLQTPQVQAAATAAIRSRMAGLAREHEAQRGVARLQLEGARHRLRSLHAERDQLQAMLELQRQRVAGAETSHANQERLRVEGFLPAAQVEQRKNELLDQRARLGELLRSQAALEREMGALTLELQSTAPKETQEQGRYERERAQLAQEAVESESRSAMPITAPIDGIATAVLAEAGQVAQAGTVLLTILPIDGSLQAKLLVPSRAIGFLALGDTVSLRYPAFPYQRYGSFKGRVVEIPRAMVAAGETDLPVVQNESVFRVSVALDAQQVETRRARVPLQSGMALEADVWLERMTLLEWFFEPLLGLARKT